MRVYRPARSTSKSLGGRHPCLLSVGLDCSTMFPESFGFYGEDVCFWLSGATPWFAGMGGCGWNGRPIGNTQMTAGLAVNKESGTVSQRVPAVSEGQKKGASKPGSREVKPSRRDYIATQGARGPMTTCFLMYDFSLHSKICISQIGIETLGFILRAPQPPRLRSGCCALALRSCGTALASRSPFVSLRMCRLA